MPKSKSNSQHQRSRSRQDSRERPRRKEDDSDRSCLYIGNIDKRVTQEKLVALFAEFGQLDYCYIVYEPHSVSERGGKPQAKQSRGYGFAKYQTPEEAQKAQEKLNGLDVNGRRMNVEFSKRNKPRDSTPGRYLGKKRSSPVRKSRHHRRSYSASSSGSDRRRSSRYTQKRSRKDQRSRSYSRRRRRSSSSRSGRR